MVNRGRFIKTKQTIDSHCWYCNSLTNYTLTFKNGDEIWCCKKCGGIYGKVKRLKKYKNHENLDNLRIKKD